MRGSPEARFWPKVQVTDLIGCWNWTGALSDGYGRFRLADRSYRAHRLAYEWQFGPVPQGFVLDHLCRNRACVNPFHLEVVTPEENSHRGVLARPACHKGHLFTPANTHLDRRGRRVCRECRRIKERLRTQQRRLAREARAAA